MSETTREKPARGYADPRVPQELRAVLAKTRPPIKGEHAGRFRWPGPRLLDKPIGGRVPENVHAERVISVDERDFGDAFAAGLEWLSWAVA